jgi:hypothetical protein
MSPRPETPPNPHIAGVPRVKILLISLFACLALAGAVAAAVAAACTIIPATAVRLDATPVPAGGTIRQVRAVGLDHCGGDLKRAPRLTRRARRRHAGPQSWAEEALMVRQRAAHQVVATARGC